MLSFLPKSITFYIILSLSIALAVLSVVSVKNYRARVEAESALVQAIDANTSMQKSLNLKDLSCKVGDTISAEFQTEKNVSEAVKQKELSAIEKLPSNPNLVDKTKVPNESNVVDIDGSLPPDLTSLLKSSYNRVSGQPSDDTRQPPN